ncbi:MAG: restriction endonuclease subunit S [Burkholderiaceae bacterium]
MTAANPSYRAWRVVRIGDICRAVNGRAFKPTEWVSDGLPIIRIQNLKNESASFNYYAGDVEPKFRVKHGDLLFAWSGTPGTSFGAHIWRGGDAVLNQHIFNLHFDREAADEHFLCYALNRNVADYVAKAQGGVGLAHITKGKFDDSTVPLPDIAEQRRIVAEIEKQFSRLDEAVANLQRVKAKLKRFRASVLKAATDGKLLGGDNKTNWRDALIGEVGQVISGLTKNPKREALPRKMPYLRVANVYANELRLSDIEYIGVADKEVEKLLVRRGDLLIVEGNGSPDQIGRVALWDGSIPDCVHQNHLIKVRFAADVAPQWALIWLLSPGGRREIERVSSSTAGLHTLSTGKISRLPIPVPPLAEQHRIVAEVDRRLSIVREVDSEVDANLKRAQALRRSVLQTAFACKLLA